MLRVREVIVVEGRYDKNTLLQAVSADVIETDGFGIFKNAEKRRYLGLLAEKRGLIVMTDPDGAGFVIRNFLKGCVDPTYVKNAYVPDIFGKERRKKTPSREGKLGVEGMEGDVLIESLRRAGATFEGEESMARTGGITKADLYALGLSGGEGSRERRLILQQRLGLPQRMTANALLQALNIITTREELISLLGLES